MRLQPAPVRALTPTNRPSRIGRVAVAAAAVSTWLLPSWALAHDGHGLSGAHWHASDTLGYLLLAVAVATGLWWARRK